MRASPSRRVRAILLAAGAAIFLPAHTESLDDVRKARDYLAQARTAREAKDAPTYLRLMQEAARARPDQPGIAYRLAGASAQNGDAAAASRLLERLAAMGLFFGAERDPDFVPVHDDASFQAAVAKLNANRAAKAVSAAAFELPDRDFIPEGIDYDPQTKTFFVASVYQRRIVARHDDGTIAAFGGGADDGLWSVIALRVDAVRRVLWVSSAAIEQTRGADPADLGRTAIFKYDLKTGKLLRRFEPPRIKEPRIFGDLALTSSGKLYISDAEQGGIWRIADDALTELLPPGTFASPQGMAFPERGNWMYVADYSLGLLRIDVVTRKVEYLDAPPDTMLLGLDGMVRHGNALIATQNGINPHRVVRIDLDAQGKVARLAVLEQSHPRYDEPTLGTVVGDNFFYVANSQWGRFEDGKLPPVEQLKGPVILKLPLAK